MPLPISPSSPHNPVKAANASRCLSTRADPIPAEAGNGRADWRSAPAFRSIQDKLQASASRDYPAAATTTPATPLRPSRLRRAPQADNASRSLCPSRRFSRFPLEGGRSHFAAPRMSLPCYSRPLSRSGHPCGKHPAPREPPVFRFAEVPSAPERCPMSHHRNVRARLCLSLSLPFVVSRRLFTYGLLAHAFGIGSLDARVPERDTFARANWGELTR